MVANMVVDKKRDDSSLLGARWKNQKFGTDDNNRKRVSWYVVA